MAPFVSIIVTCFNQDRYLERAVKSVLAQTFTNLECIIVDDGSTDNTQQIAQQLMSLDARVQYLYKENGGVSSARNFGIRNAKGEWIQCLDGDDWIHADKIRFQLSFANDAEADIVFYSDYERIFFSEAEVIIKRHLNSVTDLTIQQLVERILTPDFLTSTPFPLLQQCLLMKRSVFQIKMFNEQLKALQDRDFVLELLVSDVKFIYTPIVGAFYTKHHANRTNNWKYMEGYYILFYETVKNTHEELLPLCQSALEFLVNETLMEKDKNNFERLLDLIQYPVHLFDSRIRLNNTVLLKTIYWMRLAIPNFILYERYRGPRAKKIMSILQKGFTSAHKSQPQ